MFELKESDLPELERLAADGWNWLSRDKNNWIAVSKNEPQWSMWGYDHNGEYKWLGTWKSEVLLFVSPESKLNIAAAIAQIKAQSHAKAHGTPITWNDRINQMTVEEKAEWFMNEQCQMHNEAARYAWEKPDEFAERYKEKMEELLNRPYEEATDD